MKRLAAATIVALFVAVSVSDTAEAQQPCGWGGFQPFGFYQPYGARFGSSIATPPYFATNPPVYYGARYARPYGMSPFASPPVVSAPAGYQGRLRTQFRDSVRTSPYVSSSASRTITVARKGEVKTNPFMDPETRVAANESF